MSRFPRAVLSPGYIRSPILKYHRGKYGSVTWNTVPTILALYISCIMTDREKTIEVFKRMCGATRPDVSSATQPQVVFSL